MLVDNITPATYLYIPKEAAVHVRTNPADHLLLCHPLRPQPRRGHVPRPRQRSLRVLKVLLMSSGIYLTQGGAVLMHYPLSVPLYYANRCQLERDAAELVAL